VRRCRPTRGYQEAFSELLRSLEAELRPLAPLIGVDQLPRHYVQRDAEVSRMADMLLADLSSGGPDPRQVEPHHRVGQTN
jgi:hypothetical protein